MSDYTNERMKGIMNRYTYYNKYYENPNRYNIPDEVANSGHPILIDMMFTGCKLPYASSTYDEYNDTIESDIFFTIRYGRQALNSLFGSMRCRDNITPFAAACHNKCIPLYIIDTLLDYGADPTINILLNNREISFLKDLEQNIDSGRFTQIMNIVRTKRVYIEAQIKTFLSYAVIMSEEWRIIYPIQKIPVEILCDIFLCKA